MKRPTKNARRATQGGTLCAIALVGVLTAGTAAADPKPASPVASLVNQIATIDQNLTKLANDVAAKQENVNKALVDVQNAMAAQQVAAAADKAAKADLKRIEGLVASAQAEFDAFMRSVSRQGNNRVGSMADYVSADDPAKVLDKMTSVEQVARQQRATIRKLEHARSEQNVRVAATTATRKQTATAAQGAENRRSAAIEAVSTARKAVSDQRTQRSELMNQRAALIEKLEKTQGGQSAAAKAPPMLGEVLGNLPANKVDGGDTAAEAALTVARLAVETGTQMLAAILGEQQIPHSELLDELGIGGTTPMSNGEGGTLARLGNGSLGALFGGGGGTVRPGLRGPQAVELVINRAKSQLGQPYAWGGGDANGPTLGIRDGGVADAHGDYNKIGFDCSGLMIYAFAGIGIDLPHYTGYQYDSGPKFPLSEMVRGDMIFYGPSASTHVALYLGDGTMIEAPQSGDVVKISPVRTDGAMPQVVRLA
ncbi:NlpC/P60 family protein [Gordonia hirsuta DSM 44140 = NBRC 16056]|uniref:NlpC/P60 family protein n=1 Tax=Gordonia hirsuta DSM 44140 = NBRC 16056 TaxID=1121927 RepID=L7L8L0_9ACTN|nr:NlpC/P60 family protein [Gordonia hirsuta]GAC57269.1 NlpC/P60 family protein [Gordonia hirsuta DSM 44140 = NBRC 16056]